MFYMKVISFRVRIIGTIVFLVIISALISITFFSTLLKEKLLAHTEESVSQINILRDQYYSTINQHDGSIIRSMLKESEKDKNVLQTYLINPESKVVFPQNSSALVNDTAYIKDLYSQEKNVSIKSYPDEPVPYYRVFMKMRNRRSCTRCHDPAQKDLGIIVMDVSNKETQGIVSFTRTFGLYYTLFILFCIFTLVAYLHYKFIRKSLGQFRTKITLINQGNLDVRLDIPEVRELGSLGKDFNEMIDTFEKTQIELQLYHQKELQHSEKLATIGEMSARIAHEIRNPITGITRAIDVIISEMQDSENKPILEEIQRQANRVNQAIANLLKFSRSKDISSEPGNINEILRSILFFLSNQKHDKTIKFELDLSEIIPMFSFDHELIENVIMNLTLNAIQAIPENVLITYTTRYDVFQNKVIVSICDNGSGIIDEVGNEIFKPFYTTRTKGTGLGLAISKDIIEKHNGEIWYKNNVDVGCTFFISLPI
jgi:signal transduction histidine kinase